MNKKEFSDNLSKLVDDMPGELKKLLDIDSDDRFDTDIVLNKEQTQKYYEFRSRSYDLVNKMSQLKKELARVTDEKWDYLSESLGIHRDVEMQIDEAGEKSDTILLKYNKAQSDRYPVIKEDIAA